MVIVCLIVAALTSFVVVIIMIFQGWDWPSIAGMYLFINLASLLIIMLSPFVAPGKRDDTGEINAQFEALREMDKGGGGSSGNFDHAVSSEESFSVGSRRKHKL